jgi:hypothetical protein
MWRNNFWNWWEQNSGYIFGPCLIVIAWLIARYIEPCHPNRFVNEIVIALMIAGILAITVDPFIKRRARREATRDIFHHMLGFSLPPIIRERLQDTVEKTKFYRRNMIQHIVMSEDGNSVVFAIETEFEVVNPTPHTIAFPPLLQFEKGERAILKTVTCFEESDYDRRAKLSSSKGGLGAVEYRGKEVKIPAGGSRRFKCEYSVKYPTSMGFFYPNFNYPTIGLSLTIKAPSNFRVRATSAESESPGEWRYPNRLFMPSEHLEIVWEKDAEVS